ncbi:UNVERIFIED_CONTAM: RHOMBOID-like protein 1 [Sesamum radiatum]|uniref:RHOMBOID-like protein n=1 Tax=Sesamum radiatum TaxID=300843 RepID=A0AAW2UR86_SESRA
MGRTPYNSPPESALPIKVQPRESPYPVPHPHGQYHGYPPPLPPQHLPPPRYYAPKRWFPWLMPTFIVANIVVFVISMYINDCPARFRNCTGTSVLGRFAFQSTHENPLLGPSASTLLSLGAMDVQKVVHEHEIWRLVSCMWLHAGAFHVFANMFSLLFVGIRLEQEFGFLRIGLLYLISGVGGSLISSLFVRDTISVGASGALFGLLGAMLSELFANWTIYENKCESLLSLLIIILINMALGILPHVDNFAHLGGFFTGFLLGFVLLLRPQFAWISARNSPPGYVTKPKPKYKAYQCVLLIISMIILVAG